MNGVKIFILLLTITIGASFLTASSTRTLAISTERNEISAIADGASVYKKSCAVCHGADGRSQTKKGEETGAVDLTSEDWTPNEARDTRIITRGKGSMPSFKRSLSAAQIKSVVAYIRRFK